MNDKRRGEERRREEMIFCKPHKPQTNSRR
jgi:hypothetical protein